MMKTFWTSHRSINHLDEYVTSFYDDSELYISKDDSKKFHVLGSLISYKLEIYGYPRNAILIENCLWPHHVLVLLDDGEIVKILLEIFP